MKEFTYREKNIQEIKILLGQNKLENHELLNQQKNYWWFHAKYVPSGHAIVLSETLTPELIKFVAMQVKLNCKEKNNPNAKIEYTKLKNLKIVGIGIVELLCNPKTITL